MTAPHPVTARSPDRTRACCAGRGTLLAHEMTTGDLPSASPPKKGADCDLPYQFRPGLAPRHPLCYVYREPAGVIWGISAERTTWWRQCNEFVPYSGLAIQNLRNLARSGRLCLRSERGHDARNIRYTIEKRRDIRILVTGVYPWLYQYCQLCRRICI